MERMIVMRRIFLILFFCAVSAMPSFAGQASDVVLDDGSMIRAEVVSLQDGKYTMRSQSLGTFSLEASRVRRISRQGEEKPNPSPSSQPASSSSPDKFKSMVQDAQTTIMRDPQAMEMISALAADPAFKELTADPEAMAALQAGDIEKLKNNPRFNALMQNPRMQSIAVKLMNKSK